LVRRVKAWQKSASKRQTFSVGRVKLQKPGETFQLVASSWAKPSVKKGEAFFGSSRQRLAKASVKKSETSHALNKQIMCSL
jgi:hypothetical protein